MSKDYTGKSFHRPTDRLFYRVFGRFVPAPPENQVVFSYSSLRHHVRPKHWLVSVPAAVVTYTLLYWAFHQWGYLVLSPALLIFNYLLWAYHQGWPWLAGVIGLYLVVPTMVRKLAHEPDDVWGYRSSMGKTPGFFGSAAVFEEQWFREGSENWTWSERLRANIIFGLIHIPMLIYPFVWVAVIPFGGMALTWAYVKRFEKTGSRQMATQEAAIYHWAFNMIMAVFFVGYLVFALLKKLIGVI